MENQPSPSETMQMRSVERPDARVEALQTIVRDTVINAPETASPQMQMISEQYQNAQHLVGELSEPGKPLELISAMKGIADAAGIEDFDIEVYMKEGEHPGAEARKVAEEAKRAFDALPTIIAEHKLKKYKSIQEEEAQRYKALEDATNKAPQDVSRGEVRKLSWDRREKGYAMLDEERKMLEDTGASSDERVQLLAARREAVRGRMNTEYALAVVDKKKEQAVAQKMKDAKDYISGQEKYLKKRADEYKLGELPGTFNSIKKMATAEVPHRLSVKADMYMRKVGVLLMPVADRISAGAESVGEKAVQLRNAVKSAADVAGREIVGGAIEKVQTVADNLRAENASIRADREQAKIEKQREYYNNRHEAAVKRQMKTELELVRRSGREHGLSAARVEAMVEERRQQYAETKNPNEKIAYFQDKLREHVHTVSQLELDSGLVSVIPDAQDMRSVVETRPLPETRVDILEDDTDDLPEYRSLFETPHLTDQVQHTSTGETTQNVQQVSERPYDHVVNLGIGDTLTWFPDRDENVQTPEINKEEDILPVIKKHWYDIRGVQDAMTNKDVKEKPDIAGILKNEQAFIEDLIKRRKDGLNITNIDLNKYIDKYRAGIYLLSERHQLTPLRENQEPLNKYVFAQLYHETIVDLKNLERKINQSENTAQV